MYERLFQRQTELDPPALLRHARKLGLDPERFQHDMGAHETEVRIREDLASGGRSGVIGTPGLFINGERYDGPLERDALMAALARAAVTAAA